MRMPFLAVLLLGLAAACQKPSSRINLGDGAGSEAAVRQNASNGRPREVLDRAISAYGGDAAWEKLKRCRIRFRTVVHMPQAEKEMGYNAVVTEDCYSHPAKLRRTVQRESDGSQILLSVVNGDRMWLVSAGGPPMSRSCDPDIACPAVISGVKRLMQLRDSGQALRLEAPEEYEGRKVVPLTILSDGIPASTTYVDESTGLPVREVKQTIDASDPPESFKRTALVETVYTDYENFNGAVLPTVMQVFQAGTLMMEVKVLKVEFPETLPSELFEPLEGQAPE